MIPLHANQAQAIQIQKRLQVKDFHAPRKTRNIADAVRALTHFLRRMKRLPRKNELNIEINRLTNTLYTGFVPASKDYAKGSLYPPGKPKYFVYDNVGHLRLCPIEKWNEAKWEDPHFSKTVLGPAGLSNLQRGP